MDYREKRIGETWINNQGLKMTIIEYRNKRDVDVVFEDGFVANHREYKCIKEGHVENKNYKKAQFIRDRVGEKRINTQGLEMEVIEYDGYDHITIKFTIDGHTQKTTWRNFNKGTLLNYEYPTVEKVGIIGRDSICVDVDGNLLDSFERWRQMLTRCYGKRKRSCYEGVTVCDEWLYYPNFKKWYDKNYYKVDGCTMMLDKDIKVKGSKIYSPNTCMFVPSEINFYFTKGFSNKTLPTGVYYDKINKNYYSNICIEGKQIRLKGSQSTDIATTFSYYKKAKEEDIKRLADKYKDKIPNDVYEIIYNRTVDIND